MSAKDFSDCKIFGNVNSPTCTSIFIVLHITTVIMIVIKRMNTRKIFFLLRLLYLLLFIFSPTLSLSAVENSKKLVTALFSLCQLFVLYPHFFLVNYWQISIFAGSLCSPSLWNRGGELYAQIFFFDLGLSCFSEVSQIFSWFFSTS